MPVRGIAPPVDLGHWMEVDGKLHSQLLYSGERIPSTYWIGGWVGPIADLEDTMSKTIFS
jgi:hypothetical protein